jgi:hypothetical protein
MAYRPVFEVASFLYLPPPARERILTALVEAQIAANLEYLAQYPQTAPLYELTRTGQIVYVFNFDRWQDIPSCLDRMQGDCKDLSAWRVAELRRAGVFALVDVISRTRKTPVGDSIVYHVRVKLPSGQVEDPSVMAGMNPAGAFAPV